MANLIDYGASQSNVILVEDRGPTGSYVHFVVNNNNTYSIALTQLLS